MDKLYCDYGWYIKTGTTFTVFGGGSAYGDVDGVFFCNLNNVVDGYSWGIGANGPFGIACGSIQETTEYTGYIPTAIVTTK